jgi:hypothetical protein
VKRATRGDRPSGAPAHDERCEAARRARERREGPQRFPAGVTVTIDDDGAEVWIFDDSPPEPSPQD